MHYTAFVSEQRHVLIMINDEQKNQSIQDDVDWFTVDWEYLLPLLYRLASRFRTYRMGGIFDPEDIVFTTVEKVLSGRRNFPDHLDFNNENIYKFFYGCMQSEMSNAIQKERVLGPIGRGEEDFDPDLIASDIKDDPEMIAINDDRFTLIKKFLEHTKITESILFYEISVKVMDGFDPREIADDLNIKKDTVYNAKKKLRKLFKEYLYPTCSGLQT